MTKTLSAAVSRIFLCFCVSILAQTAAAQGAGSIVESQGFTPGQASVQASQSGASGSNEALSLLLNQIQDLQAEVQALRGAVEEQGFEIRKMQRDSLSRYTSTDERLSNLESSTVAATGTAATPTTQATASTSPIGTSSTAPAAVTDNIPATRAAVSDPVTSTPLSNARSGAPISNAGNSSRSVSRPGSRGTLQPAVLSEQQLYQMAYDSAINSNFERSIAEFDQYLSIYPAGRFVSNVHYWKGQAYFYLNRYGEARDSYEIILERYPDSPKLPDAMYGLSQAYQGLGNLAQVRQLLNEIKRRFPNTSAANLADARLLSLD